MFVCILSRLFGGADLCANQCLIVRDAHARHKVARCVIAQSQYRKTQSGRAFPVCGTRSSRGNRERKKSTGTDRKGAGNTFNSDSHKEKDGDERHGGARSGEKQKKNSNTWQNRRCATRFPWGEEVAATCSVVVAVFPFRLLLRVMNWTLLASFLKKRSAFEKKKIMNRKWQTLTEKNFSLDNGERKKHCKKGGEQRQT